MKSYPSAITSTISCMHITIACKHSVIFTTMSADVARTAGFSIVGSRVDFCSALLYGAGSGLLNKLQSSKQSGPNRMRYLQRWETKSWTAMRTSLAAGRRRTNFKISLLCYKSLRHGQPNYIRTLLTSYILSHCLHSSVHDLLSVRTANLETAAWRFSLAAPRVWNALPQTVRQAKTVSAFKSAPKTHFFHQNT
jgi:hypothetical protein